VPVVDRQTPLYFSAAPREGPDGRLTRDWQRLAITDGVAVAQIPPSADTDSAVILARYTPPAADERDRHGLLWLERASEYLDVVDKIRNGEPIVTRYPSEDDRLQWSDPAARDMRVGQARTVPSDIANTFSQAVEEGGFLDLGANTRGHSLWYVIAGLSDGRTALVGEIQDGTRDSRLYAVLLAPDGKPDDVVSGGDIDPTSALPVALRLPDAQGWIAAVYGAAIQYRTSADGAWQPGGDNAALLPSDATHAQVSRPDSKPEIVDLNG